MIVEYDGVGCGQIDTETTGLGTEQEDEEIRARKEQCGQSILFYATK